MDFDADPTVSLAVEIESNVPRRGLGKAMKERLSKVAIRAIKSKANIK
jgi:hypothetical protein